ncbi:MAG: hypothetical protein IJ699_01335 [Bacteroidaceae bacterium]|nr:hypothetical protein [Bacteroidaceae bacterium]
MLEQPRLRSLTFLLQSYEKSFEEHASGLLFSTFCAKNFAMFSESDTFAVEITNINLLMKGFIATLLLAFASTAVFAQRNPVPGYIITNENDTIYGTLDYLSPKVCCKECHFRPSGEKEFKVYKPADLKEYHLKDADVFYISRVFRIDNTDWNVFAQYLVKGGVSLYCYTLENYVYYFFEGENGEVQYIKQQNRSNVEDDMLSPKERRLNAEKMADIFSKDYATLQSLYSTDYTPDDLAQLVRKYDELYCTDNSCVQFDYDRKHSALFRFRPLLEVGAYYGHLFCEDGYTYNGFSPRFLGGVEMSSERVAPGLAVLVKLGVNLYSPTSKHADFEGIIDLSYRFLPKKKFSPFIEGGVSICNRIGMGIHAGAGCDMKIGKHRFQLSVTYGHYTKTSYFSSDGKINSITTSAAFLF